MNDRALAEQAYEELYSHSSKRRLEVTYHGRLKGYNATVTQNIRTTTFRLSRRLEHCEPEIKIGIMQYLLNKLNKTKIETENIDFYHNFVKKMSDYAPVTKKDPLLEQSFQRMNEGYFHGMMTMPNLVWGRRNKNLLGTYAYGTDTITISRVLEDAPQELLDYVMYHEMLHKKHKFSCSSGRTHSHTPAFKKDEAKYAVKNAEQQLTRFLRSTRQQPRKVAQQTFLQRVMGWR